MPAKYLHIISFNIPYPPNYGGVIDVFYKIKALREAGIQVILHCFEYGRQHSKELEEFCFKVHYYPRKAGISYFLRNDPYIVLTRSSNSMPNNLLKDSFPVLFEGLHSTTLLDACINAKKKVLVRTHNIEHQYYRALARSDPNWLRKIFFISESLKLKHYEGILHRADHILAIARHETSYFKKTYGHTTFIPAFHPFEGIRTLTGTGEYILLHGNLGVAENSEVILRLADVLKKTSHNVVVAGKNPSLRLRKKLSQYARIRVVVEPSDDELDRLIQHAQINLLHTYQTTGVKLKLLYALFSGRHCLVNPQMVEGAGLAQLCTISHSEDELLSLIDQLMTTPFEPAQLLERKKALKEYSNRASAEKIIMLMD